MLRQLIRYNNSPECTCVSSYLPLNGQQNEGFRRGLPLSNQMAVAFFVLRRYAVVVIEDFSSWLVLPQRDYGKHEVSIRGVLPSTWALTCRQFT
ncbi:hypothetical protein M404DRAFT_993719 [Pisolithus tinctorius Marx 270]|uniref:Uncharacterized protein n=1 Tax=Pisolithus tinctorius Marx 270 TaxID=870435 RepID=A0A0C3KT95_PISTI|nr:hypothetical protein M404DRAFT_993719 [Pisolithus tinctorius Marx 270]